MASTYTPIATTTLGSAASSVTFSSISGAYTDLILICSSTVLTYGTLELQVGNGSIDTGTNYSRTYVYGDGTSAGSQRNTSVNQIYMVAGASSSVVATAIVNFQNYSNTSTYKTMLLRGSSAAAAVDATVGLWRSTSAINTIKIAGYSGNNISAGSTFTLYGIKAA